MPLDGSGQPKGVAMSHGTENMERAGRVRRNVSQGREDRRAFVVAQSKRRQDRRSARRAAARNRAAMAAEAAAV